MGDPTNHFAFNERDTCFDFHANIARRAFKL